MASKKLVLGEPGGDVLDWVVCPGRCDKIPGYLPGNAKYPGNFQNFPGIFPGTGLRNPGNSPGEFSFPGFYPGKYPGNYLGTYPGNDPGNLWRITVDTVQDAVGFTLV